MDTISPSTSPAPKRRAATFTVRPELLEQARALKLNASRAAEAGLEAAIKDAMGKAWMEENREAILAHNERIAQHGTLLRPVWMRD